MNPASIAETDAALIRSLPPSVRSCLEIKTEGRWNKDESFRGYVTIVTPTTAIGDELLAVARETVAESIAPMERNELIKALGKLKLLTAARGVGETDLTLQLAAYADELAQWPADVVREVLERQPRRSKWWPAWAELYDLLSELAAPRNALLAALAPPKGKPRREYLGQGSWRNL